MRKPSRSSALRAIRVIIALAALVAVSLVRTVPKYRTVTERAGDAGAITATGPVTASGGHSARGGPVVIVKPGTQAFADCQAGRNGGATDTGVTANSIKLGATVVETGIARTFLADVRQAMVAVVNNVNASGGICGRRLELVLKDDGWDPNTGYTYLQNLVDGENVFALSVVPSSEGLRAATKWLESRNVPVVGTDGMLINQYTSPIIWPVAASTITAMHILAKNAWDRGFRNFSMVYDANYHFGIEGAYAFNAAFKRLSGSDIPGYSDPLSGSAQCGGRFCGIQAGNPSYGPELQQFKSACHQTPACDFVVYLLEPDTAQKWMAGGGTQASEAAIGGTQPLFNSAFGVACGDKCHGMWVWTGYVPPIAPFTNLGAVQDYVSTIGSNQQTDPKNSFVEGGYVGMQLLVNAMRNVGPNLTRAGLMTVLNATKLDIGLSRPLSWTQGNHFANQCMMGFSIQARPSFAGWRKETDWVCDPWLGQDLPPER